MRANGLINLILVSSATACLMAVVSNPDEIQSEMQASWEPPAHVLPPDTPETADEPEPLIFDFKENNTGNPLNQPQSKLYLEQPQNIKTSVEYDPKSGNYNIRQKVGERNYRPETYLNLKEYREYLFKKQMREYWRSRVAADDLNEKPRTGLIPPLKINSELFDRIFGGNTVDIKPTGTAELIFGLTHNRTLNPAIPQRQQSNTNFDFNMRIQLNLIGKIGDKLKVTTNYNTEASFDWENQVKVDYTGYEDDIIKKIEAGNVTLPLNSSLISGSQTLFGFKTELQFGRLRATTVISQQKGKKQEVTVQGGAQLQHFSINGDNYEQNKHFFLGHYFRRNYDRWMQTLPVISTPVVITKIEVYLLGVNGSAEQTRNIVAFEDLGEDDADIAPNMRGVSNPKYQIIDGRPDSVPTNDANTLFRIMTNPEDGILRSRRIDDVTSTLSSSIITSNVLNSGDYYMDPGKDYNIIRNARRLNPSEYFFNPRTGFISLNQQLNNEQALAVSYQYTYGGETFQVGEFSEFIPDNTKLLVCKLLKSSVVNVKQPVWRLMMKNVYALGAYNLNPQDFKLDVYYNNIETGVDVPYIPEGSGRFVKGIQLIRVLNADRLSVNGDPQPDGVYDFIQDFTIFKMNGRAYFPTAEPFGRGLEAKFEADEVALKDKYVFKELYDSTKTAASFMQNKNRFKIKGSYRSSSGSEIALNALNIPQGAVVVTANGVTLTENVDYTVDYTLGRVRIINDGYLNSGATIKVSLESNSLFSVQQKSLIGTRLDYKANRNLTLGSTILRYSERPLTQKVSIGDEPVTNWVLGLDVNHKTDAPFLTRLLDKLPFFSTKEMSTITTRAEWAKLFPGNAAAIEKNGGNSYVDDFEGSISLIDIKSANSWFLASIPQNQPALFPEASLSNNIINGMNRAKLSWYNVDAMFTREQGAGTTPEYYSTKRLFSNNMWRQVFETELFPGKTPPNGQQVVLPMLDLLYFPDVRGPYNYDVLGTNYSKGINTDGTLKNPKSRWAGIMRRLETNDFQAANVEYIQFWLMDPFNEDYNKETDPAFDPAQRPSGDLYIDIGNISEDIIRDGRMVYENGLPGPSGISNSLRVDTNSVANIPQSPPVINVFSQDNNDRAAQDVGYDGLDDNAERERFRRALDDMNNGAFADSVKQRFTEDPSSDRYHFFRGDDYDRSQANTLRRYMHYNNPEGNSPTEAQYSGANPNGGNYSTSATNQPNIEDINRDNTLSEAENYYQYHVNINDRDISESAVGRNFIVDAFTGTADFSGESKVVKWYQFKIPVSQFEDNVGGLEGFNSIRFMRVYLRNFDRPVLLRMARFELVRSDWRRYQYDLRQPDERIINDNSNTSFDVSAVSLQENSNKVPVNYVMPPDIDQQQNVQTTNLVLLNEQALQMRMCDLKDGDSRAVFKNVELDTRMFNNIKMNVHGEALINDDGLKDGDLELFFRVGSDYNNNFYEYSIPLKLTPKGVYDPNNSDHRRIVWPSENEVNLKFEDINRIKDERNSRYGYFSNLSLLSQPYTRSFEGYSITIVGNPNLGTVKSVMVGVRNPKNDGKSHCAEVWINELRLTNFNNQGGWAATAQVQAKLADLGMLSMSGTYKTPFFGGVESKINDRSRETNLNWDVSTSINFGKFFPAKWKVTLPMFYNYGQTRITPLFNPLDPDVRMDDFNDNGNISDGLKDSIQEKVIDYTERKGFNLSNVRIDGLKREKKKPYPWDISNFTVTYAYNEIFRRSMNVEYNYTRSYRGNLQYQFAFKNPYSWKPFAKKKMFEKKSLALIKDFNLQLMPNSFGFSTDVNRTYAAVKNRDITSFYGGSSDFVNPTLVNKNFTMTRSYNFRWDISKSIKYDYTATNEGRIMELPGESWKSDEPSRDYVKNTFLEGRDSLGNRRMGKYGENVSFRQQMNLNVDVPINKIPILDFIKTNYRFSGTYTWLRRPFAAEDVGNTIQNTGNHSGTANFNLTSLYNKIPYFRKLMSPGGTGPARANTSLKKPADVAKKDTAQKKSSGFKDLGEFLVRGILMIKNLQVTYAETRGQGLPNFMPNAQYGGMDFRPGRNNAPGFLFTTGLYDDGIRDRSIRNGWLKQIRTQTTPYVETFSRTYSYKSSVEPHGSLRIELSGNYTRAENRSEYIVFDQATGKFNLNQSPNVTGNFNMTTLTFFNSFKDGSDPVKSTIFDEFMNERVTIARELRRNNTAPRLLANHDHDGYSLNQQDVLLGTFNRVYVGRDINNYSTKNIFPAIPLPNWTLTWDGLGKLKKMKKYFKSVTVRHGYKNTYNISGFTNNILFNPDGQTQDKRVPGSGDSANFVSYYLINSVTMSERFDPIVKLDFQFVKPGWTASMEYKKDRTTTLNLASFQIIETKGQEIIIGLGYMYPKLKIRKIKIQGKPLESNLTIKVDMSFRKNIHILRQITDGNSTPTNGTNIFTLRSSANYQLTQNVTLRLFLDWIRSTPQTSATFPSTNINGGFSLLINFQ